MVHGWAKPKWSEISPCECLGSTTHILMHRADHAAPKAMHHGVPVATFLPVLSAGSSHHLSHHSPSEQLHTITIVWPEAGGPVLPLPLLAQLQKQQISLRDAEKEKLGICCALPLAFLSFSMYPCCSIRNNEELAMTTAGNEYLNPLHRCCCLFATPLHSALP